VRFAGREVTRLPEHAIVRLGVGRKFQRPTIFPGHTVFENLELTTHGQKGVMSRLFNRPSASDLQSIERTLDLIGLAEHRDRLGGLLSHGQKQWLEIGMLLVQKPKLLLVDEPVAGMTQQEIERTEQILASLAGEHTVVVVEHDMDFVRSIARTVTKAASSPRARCVTCKTIHVSSKYTWEHDVLVTRDVHQYYGGSHTLRGASLSIPEGTCICLMGRNGVGKTTLLRAIMGLVAVRSGSIRFGERELVGADASERARVGIGYVPQGREIFPELTVEENLRVGTLAQVGAARQIPELVFRLFPVLRTMMGRRGGDLSGGQQQQLAIARALTLRPKCILLDEPTEGIQPSIVHELGDVIRRLYSEEGVGVLLVEQKLPFARRVAERFYLMDRGAVVSTGTMAELSEELVRKHLAV
jgi:urea transport system ATP-binding protein